MVFRYNNHIERQNVKREKKALEMLVYIVVTSTQGTCSKDLTSVYIIEHEATQLLLLNCYGTHENNL